MLRLNRQLIEQIFDHAQAGRPEEVCGYLAGLMRSAAGSEPIAEATSVYRIDNADKSIVAYRMDPAQQLKAEKQIRARGLKILGVYHSHPSSPAYPSETDVDCAHWPGTNELLFPEASYVIVSLLQPGRPELRSFRIRGRRVPEDVIEERVEIANSPNHDSRKGVGQWY